MLKKAFFHQTLLIKKATVFVPSMFFRLVEYMHERRLVPINSDSVI
jgi:hypothetical protein